MEPPPDGEHVDVAVVGSGFGGAVAAHRLGEAGLRVAVLERGAAHPPGSFARTPAEAARNFWSPAAGLHGLFDYWSFRGIDALVASGLGGGSLIYANVLLRRDDDAFAREGWPVSAADLAPHYDRVERALQPVPLPADRGVPKAQAFAAAGRRLGLEPFHPPLAVAFGAGPGEPLGDDNLHGVHRQSCRLCGECTIGCNFGAKNTLDLTYLSTAQASLHPLCEVRQIAPRPGGGYTLSYVAHEAGGPPRTLTADRVVLAAGALATTRLLLRSRRALPGLGPALGTHFSGNGDFLAFCRGSRQELEAARGPTITTAVRGEDWWLEDAGVPVFAAWLAQVTDVPRALWRYRRFAARYAPLKLGFNVRTDMSAGLAALFGGGRRSAGTLPLLGMGRDTPSGVLRLRRGRLSVEWRTRESDAFFRRLRAAARAMAAELGGSYADNPMWWLRRVITVHPLGGAPMGRSPATGVVDPWGECFGHPGLHVTCGAAMPGPVGPNPALTIAAWADRAAERIAERA